MFCEINKNNRENHSRQWRNPPEKWCSEKPPFLPGIPQETEWFPPERWTSWIIEPWHQFSTHFAQDLEHQAHLEHQTHLEHHSYTFLGCLLCASLRIFPRSTMFMYSYEIDKETYLADQVKPILSINAKSAWCSSWAWYSIRGWYSSWTNAQGFENWMKMFHSHNVIAQWCLS